jgi:hypothetical protein
MYIQGGLLELKKEMQLEVKAYCMSYREEKTLCEDIDEVRVGEVPQTSFTLCPIYIASSANPRGELRFESRR